MKRVFPSGTDEMGGKEKADQTENLRIPGSGGFGAGKKS
jgi:hypothetical protein